MMTAREELQRRQCIARDEALRAEFMKHVISGLPIDGDPAETRVPMVRIGAPMKKIMEELLAQANPFFARVQAVWAKQFADVPAIPGRWDDGDKLFLYTESSAALFSLRPRLSALRKKLAALEGAPAKFTVHLEIHAVPRNGDGSRQKGCRT